MMGMCERDIESHNECVIVWSDDAWLQKHAVPQTEPAEEAKSPSEPPPPSP